MSFKGFSGIALVLYQELSGLAGSSMFSRVSRTLRESAGKPQGGRSVAASNLVREQWRHPWQFSSAARTRFWQLQKRFFHINLIATESLSVARVLVINLGSSRCLRICVASAVWKWNIVIESAPTTRLVASKPSGRECFKASHKLLWFYE